MLKFLKEGHLKFIKYNIKNNKNKNLINYKNKILVDYFDDYPTIFVFSAFKNYLQNKYKANFQYFTFNSWQNPQLSFNRTFFDNIRSVFNFFGANRILSKIFMSFGVHKGITIDYNNLLFKKKAQIFAQKSFKKLKKLDDIYLIKYNNFTLGKYVYQSYLRDYTEPTIDLNDKRLFKIIEKAILIYLSIDSYFKKNHVKILIPSHTVYLYYGMIADYAYKKKIKVFRIKSAGYYDKTSLKLINVDSRINESYPTHRYKKIFDSFNNIEKKRYRKLGKKHLIDRFKGKHEKFLSGEKIIYHKKKISMNIINSEKNVLMFIPCFFDGPGRHDNLLFPDFFQWVIFMLDNAKDTNFNWYIKPHPLGRPGNNIIIKNLIKKYKKFSNIIFLEKDISNKYLINKNFKSFFCHHGNAISEFAYKNIPVVCACRDFSSEFNIALKPKNKSHLKKLILNADKIKYRANKKNIYEFIFMHFIYFMGFEENNRIFIKDLNKDIKKFHDLNKSSINSHKFFSLFNDNDYKYAEKKVVSLLKKIGI
jgi:hypothetical protein